MPREITTPSQSDAIPASEPVLDLERLCSFTEGNSQVERALSDLFLATAESHLQRMREALAAGRPWSSIAHALKGASGNLGARRLAALALQAERSGPDRAQLEALEHAMQQVRALFTERVAT